MDTIIMRFTVNGKDQGIAFRIPKKSLEVSLADQAVQDNSRLRILK